MADHVPVTPHKLRWMQVASFSSSRYVLEFIEQPLKQHWETSFIEVCASALVSFKAFMSTLRLAAEHRSVCAEPPDKRDREAG